MTASPLEPDQAFAAFDGQNPAGNWVLTIVDNRHDAPTVQIGGWSLTLSACATTPGGQPTSVTNATPTPVPHAGTAASAVSVAMSGCFLESAKLRTTIVNNSAAALSLALTSPAGHIVTITSGNGPPSQANTFDGTTWNDQAPTRVTSGTLGGGLQALLEPEQGLANFIGENPNGSWTLTVTDGAADSATLGSWGLDLVSAGSCPPPPAVQPPPAAQPSPATPPPPAALAAQPPPVITSTTQTASRWRESTTLPQISRRRLPVGTTFGFHLNEPASVGFVFTQSAPGRRVGMACVRQTPRNRRRRRCSRTLIAGRLRFNGHAGANAVHFRGRLSSGAKLKPGHYTLVITAANAAGVSSKSLSFTIVKR